MEYARNITGTLNDSDKPTIKDSCKQLLNNMENYVNQNINIKKLTSMTIFKDLDSKKKLFVGAGITMQVIICASVEISVESFVESLVPRYEGHFTKNRYLEENNALDEMMIAENGPSLFKPDEVISNVMSQYWKSESRSGRWNFVRESRSVLD